MPIIAERLFSFSWYVPRKNKNNSFLTFVMTYNCLFQNIRQKLIRHVFWLMIINWHYKGHWHFCACRTPIRPQKLHSQRLKIAHFNGIHGVITQKRTTFSMARIIIKANNRLQNDSHKRGNHPWNVARLNGTSQIIIIWQILTEINGLRTFMALPHFATSRKCGT